MHTGSSSPHKPAISGNLGLLFSLFETSGFPFNSEWRACAGILYVLSLFTASTDVQTDMSHFPDLHCQITPAEFELLMTIMANEIATVGQSYLPGI